MGMRPSTPMDEKTRLFFLAAGGFVVGIFIRSFYTVPLSLFLALFFIAGVLVGGGILLRRRGCHAGVFVGAALLSCLVGIGRVALTPQSLPPSLASRVGEKVSLAGTVFSEPDRRATYQNVLVRVSAEGSVARILVRAPLSVPLSYGTKVTVRGTLKKPQPFSTAYNRSFPYDRYLAAQGVFAVMPYATVSVDSPPTGFFTHAYGALLMVKEKFLRALTRALPEPSASLAGGILAGGTAGLGKSLTDDFVRTGLIHIVVLSGYNVMIIADAILFALSFMAPRAAASIAAFFVGGFVLAAGAGAASIRAGIMAGFALLARVFGRTYSVTRALVAAILLMLFVNPLLLAFSLGFDLSVLATFGLIFGAPLIEAKLIFLKNAFLRETIAATTAAQIAVLPLLLYSNGIFSLVALPANILVLPVVPFAMAASFLAAVAGFVAPAAAPVAGLPAYVLLSYITDVVHGASRLPLAAFAFPAFPFAWTVLAYALLAFFTVRLIKKKNPAVATAGEGTF